MPNNIKKNKFAKNSDVDFFLKKILKQFKEKLEAEFRFQEIQTVKFHWVFVLFSSSDRCKFPSRQVEKKSDKRNQSKDIDFNHKNVQ